MALRITDTRINCDVCELVRPKQAISMGLSIIRSARFKV